jgi:uncharacterized protein YgbK (DUF1537 family)
MLKYPRSDGEQERHGMGQIYFGCVGDDFTGASDAASFLKKGGFRTVLYNGLPTEGTDAIPADAAVVALKTRTADRDLAVRKSLDVVKWLRNDTKINETFSHARFSVNYCSL